MKGEEDLKYVARGIGVRGGNTVFHWGTGKTPSAALTRMKKQGDVSRGIWVVKMPEGLKSITIGFGVLQWEYADPNDPRLDPDAPWVEPELIFDSRRKVNN